MKVHSEAGHRLGIMILSLKLIILLPASLMDREILSLVYILAIVKSHMLAYLEKVLVR